jgi:glucan-binding YG repeat protein
MMISSREQYAELLALTKRYLLQEWMPGDKILSEAETYSYFKAYALQNQKKGAVKTVPDQRGGLDKSSPIKAVTSHRTPNEERSHRTPNVASSHRTPNEEKSTPKVESVTATETVTVTGSSPNFTELRKIIQEKLPHIHLLDQLPDDSEAKALANNWTKEKQAAQIIILSFDEPAKHQLFLENIAKALKLFGFHAVVANAMKMEWQKMLQSNALKLIVAGSSGFHNLAELQKHHREDARQGRHYLGDRPLLLLSDIGFYLKEPTLKPSLWKALKELLAIP